MQIFGEVDLGPRQPRDVHRLDALSSHQEMERVLVLADAPGYRR